MRIDRIHLQNFRCFADREFSFAPRFNLIVGDNATGKTALLDAMAVGIGSLLLGMRSPTPVRSIHRDEVRWKFYQHGDTVTAEPQCPARIECFGEVSGKVGRWARELTTVKGRTTRQEAQWIRDIANELQKDVSHGDSTTLPLISYYGTGRIWVQRRQRKVTTLSPKSRLQGYLDCLASASDEKRLMAWFKTREVASVQKGESSPTLEACRRAILACIPEAEHVYFDVLRDEMMLKLAGDEMPFSYLSDGFRNMLGMAADISVRSATLNPWMTERTAQETPGVVLIDEIDLHLHPLWQRRVIGDLLRAFPSIQFIATTHSPFVIQSLPPNESIRLINLDDSSATDFAHKSVEDITEEVQGVEMPQRSKRFLEMMDTAKHYYKLLESTDGATKEETKRLKTRLDELMMPFSDDAAYQAFLRMQRLASGVDEEKA